VDMKARIVFKDGGILFSISNFHLAETVLF